MAAHTTSDLDTYAETTIHYKVGRLIGHHGFCEQDREDLEQELALAVIERLRGFSPAQVQRNTFIAKVIDQRIADLIRYRERECRQPMQDLEGADQETVTANDLGSLPDPKSEGEQERAELRMDLQDAMACLTTRQQAICRLLGSYTKVEIEQRLGIGRRILESDLASIRAAFVKAGLESHLGG